MTGERTAYLIQPRKENSDHKFHKSMVLGFLNVNQLKEGNLYVGKP